MLKMFFGQSPTPNMPTWVYNSMIGIGGAFLYTDSWFHFFGLVLMLESVLVSIERCWPKAERPEA